MFLLFYHVEHFSFNSTQHWCFPHLQSMEGLQTFQGVSIDSLVAGAIKIGCKNVPDCRQCHQEALKHCPTTPTWFLHLLTKKKFRGGVRTPSIHSMPPGWWVAIKGEISFFGCWTFTQTAHSWASWWMGFAAQRRGVVVYIFANIEDTEKCFHVPATSSEALGTSNSVAGTWKCFPASSMLAMWAWGLWVVVIWHVACMCVWVYSAEVVARELQISNKDKYQGVPDP